MSEIRDRNDEPASSPTAPVASDPAEALQPDPESRPERPAPSVPVAGSRLTALALLLAVLALGLAGYAHWRLIAEADALADPAQLAATAVRRAVAELEPRLEAIEREAAARSAALQGRLESALAVNNVLREQLLGLQERADLAERALARLAETRSGADQLLLLAQAEALMVQAQQRLLIGGDLGQALSLLELADAELAQIADPAYGGVRARLAAEIDALRAVPRVDVFALAAELRELGDTLLALRLASAFAPAGGAVAETEHGLWPRLRAALLGFVRVTRVSSGDAGPVTPLDLALAREQLGLQLELAELALVRRDASAWAASLDRAAQLLRQRFDLEDPAGRRAARAVERLLGEDIAPDLPDIGRALRELRNLRNVRALGEGYGEPR